jgi:predicted outer membrane repeat protein
LCGAAVVVLAAGGLWGGLAAAGPADAGAGLYAAPAAVGAGDCSSAADACTLATALSDAAAGDTVYLVQPGTEGTASTYYIGNWDLATAGTSAGAQVTIAPAAGLASPPILDGDGTSAGTCQTASCDGPVLTIGANVHATVQGITIQNGDNTSTGAGGGIDNGNGATLTVTDATFTGNSATGSDGGAIDNGDTYGSGTLTVTGSTFTGNSAVDGGAIDNGDTGGSGTLTVTGSTFTGNSGGDGGAIDNGDNIGSGTLTVTGSTFTGNSAVDGGAIDDSDNSGSGTATVTGSTFTTNTALEDGGAIDNGDNYGSGTVTVTGSTFTGNSARAGGAIDNAENYGSGSGTVTVTGSTFTGNSALTGGAIDNGDNYGSGTLTVTGSTFTGNTAKDDGGAIDNGDTYGSGTLTVTGSTFTGNSAVDGGAIDNSDNHGSGTLTVTDSTFAANTATSNGATIDNGETGGEASVDVAADIFYGGCAQAGGSWDDAGYNAGTDASCEKGGTSDSTALTPSELGPLASNGGPTQTMLPLAGNPALGIVPPATTVSLGGGSVTLCPVTDQRGITSAPGKACDAGAVQIQLAAGRPSVTRVTPAAGPVTGGTTITITGTRFTPGARVELGQGAGPGPTAIMATSVHVTSAQKITAVTGGPARPGNWHVFVITPGGTSPATPASAYHYDAPPVITALTPAHGPAGGGTRVTIHGSDLKPGGTVLFGTTPAGHLTYLSAREVTVTAPAGTGTVTVTITTPGGTSAPTPHDQYHYT